MAGKPLEADVRHRAKRAIIDLRGDIDAAAEVALNSAYAKAESQNPDTILLNFTGVEYINSTGIALIVGLLAKARQSHRCLQTCGLSDHYVEIFQMTRLSDFIRIFPDEASAVADESAAP